MTRRRRRRHTEETQMAIPHPAADYLAAVVETLVPVFGRYPAFYG